MEGLAGAQGRSLPLLGPLGSHTFPNCTCHHVGHRAGNDRAVQPEPTALGPPKGAWRGGDAQGWAGGSPSPRGSLSPCHCVGSWGSGSVFTVWNVCDTCAVCWLWVMSPVCPLRAPHMSLCPPCTPSVCSMLTLFPVWPWCDLGVFAPCACHTRFAHSVHTQGECTHTSRVWQQRWVSAARHRDTRTGSCSLGFPSQCSSLWNWLPGNVHKTTHVCAGPEHRPRGCLHKHTHTHMIMCCFLSARVFILVYHPCFPHRTRALPLLLTAGPRVLPKFPPGAQPGPQVWGHSRSLHWWPLLCGQCKGPCWAREHWQLTGHSSGLPNVFFRETQILMHLSPPIPSLPPDHIQCPWGANMGLAAANSPCPSSSQDLLMVILLLCPQGVTCPHTSVFHQDPQSCGVSRSCWSPTLQDWLRENRKASGAVPEGSYCWPGSRGSVRGRRHRGHPVTPLSHLWLPTPPWMCPSVGRQLLRASPCTPLLCFGRENK